MFKCMLSVLQDDDQEATQEARQRLEAVHRLVPISMYTKDRFVKVNRHKISSILLIPYHINVYQR